jgi:hypothetical protein
VMCLRCDVMCLREKEKTREGCDVCCELLQALQAEMAKLAELANLSWPSEAELASWAERLQAERLEAERL